MFSFFTTGTFWVLMGILFVGIFRGAKVWFEEKGFKMNWWKWLLTALWYGFVLMSVAAPFTFLAEGEPQGFWGIGAVMIVSSIILGVGLWRLLIADRAEPMKA